MVHDEIHSPLGAAYNPGKVKQGLRAQMDFSHTIYSHQVSALTWTYLCKFDEVLTFV